MVERPARTFPHNQSTRRNGLIGGGVRDLASITLALALIHQPADRAPHRSDSPPEL